MKKHTFTNYSADYTLNKKEKRKKKEACEPIFTINIGIGLNGAIGVNEPKLVVLKCHTLVSLHLSDLFISHGVPSSLKASFKSELDP
jgi:hypothetical protein